MLVGIAGAIFLGVSWIQGPMRERAHQAEQEAFLEARKAHLERRRQSMDLYLDRLETDPAFVSRVAREQLGLVEEGEMLFTFDERSQEEVLRFPVREPED